VGLIDNQYARSAALRLLLQQCIQRKQNIRLRLAIALQVKIVSHHFEKLIGMKERIGAKRKLDALRGQLISKARQSSRFARSHLARRNNKTLPAAHTVDEVRKRLFVLWAAVKKLRIRA